MKNHLKHLLVVSALAMAGTSTTMAQSVLRGKVVDAETGEPLIGATVSVKNVKVVTDIDGAFAVKGVSGAKEVSIQYIGYKQKTVKVAGNGELGNIVRFLRMWL